MTETIGTIPTIKAALNLAIKLDNCPSSNRDREAYEGLFEPIGLSWLHYNTLKYNGALKWMTLEPNETLSLSDCKSTTNIGTNLKDLTKRALEKEIYWLYEGATNDEYTSNIVFASNIKRSK